MKDVIVKFTPEEQMELRGIVLDGDAERALAFARLVLERMCRAESGRMKSHLDR